MSRLLLFVLLATFALGLHAQQIPWEPSFREPYTVPKSFVGLSAQSGLSIHEASLTYLDDIYGIPCCTYEGGTGIPLAIGVSSEHWAMANLSVGGDALIAWETTAFATNPSVVPRANGEDLRTRYEMSASMAWLSLSLGAKYRIMQSPWTVGVRLAGNVLLNSTMTHKEVVLGPDSYFFLTDPPSKEIFLPTTGISDLHSFVLLPAVQVSYDLPLSYPVYVSPYIGIGTTLGSFSEQQPWGVTSVSLGVRLLHGL